LEIRIKVYLYIHYYYYYYYYYLSLSFLCFFNRIASLTKSAANANGEAPFQVCELGIRDIAQLKHTGNNENKRQKI
jgi:hypothetical protein